MSELRCSLSSLATVINKHTYDWCNIFTCAGGDSVGLLLAVYAFEVLVEGVTPQRVCDADRRPQHEGE